MAMGITRKQLVLVCVLIFGTFVAVLNQTVVSPMLPKVMVEMSVDASTAQWLATGFTLVNAVMIPVTAFLMDKFSLRAIFCVSMSIFVAGSLLAGWGPTFGVLLAGRMVQAAGAGVLQPLVMTVLLRTFPVERRGTAMGIFGIVIAFAPAIGPTLAGFVVDTVGWRVLFYGIAVLAALVIVVSMFALEKSEATNPDAHLDVPSVILSCLGFGGLLYGLSSIGSSGSTVVSFAGLIVGAIALVFFFRRQLTLDEPMLNVRVLKNRRFLTATVIIMLVQGSLMAGAVLAPIFMQTDLRMSATESGVAMLPAAIIMGVMGLVSGRLFDKHGPRWLGIIGLALMTLSTVLFAFIDLSATFAYLMILYAVRMFGLALVNMPLNTWGMNALDDELISHGTALNNTFRQVAGSLGTALIVSISTAASTSQAGAMSPLDASVYGIDIAFAVAAAICFIGFIIVIVLVRDEPKGALPEEASASALEVTELIKAEPYALPSSATVLDAMRLLSDKKIGSVTVVDDQRKLAGFVSDGDIMRHLSRRDEVLTDPMSMITLVIGADAAGRGIYSRMGDLMQMNIMAIAKKPVISVEIGDNLKEVCQVLGAYHLKKIPVVDGTGTLVGLIDRSDEVRHFMAVCVDEAGLEEGRTPELSS